VEKSRLIVLFCDSGRRFSQPYYLFGGWVQQFGKFSLAQDGALQTE